MNVPKNGVVYVTVSILLFVPEAPTLRAALSHSLDSPVVSLVMELLLVELLSGKLEASDRVTQSRWCRGLKQDLLLPGHYERADK